MQLARDLHMSRNRLLSEMDSREITDWLAFYIVRNKAKQKNEYNEKQTTLHEKFKSIMGGRLVKKPKKE